MPATCGICGHRYTKEAPMNFSYFKIPNKPLERAQAWAEVLRSARRPEDRFTEDGQIWQPTRHHRVCAKHFITGKPNENAEHPDYIPNQHLEGLKSKKLSLYAASQAQATEQSHSHSQSPSKSNGRVGRPSGVGAKRPKREETTAHIDRGGRYTLSHYVKGEDKVRTFTCLLPSAVFPDVEEKGTQTVSGSLLDVQLLKAKVSTLEREMKQMEKERDQQSLQIQELQAENRRLRTQTENTYYICQ